MIGNEPKAMSGSAPLNMVLDLDIEPLPTLGDFEGGKEFLSSKEWPPSLIESFLLNVQKTPLRYYVADDSTSMQARDGQLLQNVDGAMKLVQSNSIISYICAYFALD